MLKILIQSDGNEEIKVIHFQHNGEDRYVPVGEVTKVPNWVVEQNPNYPIKIIERIDDNEDSKEQPKK